MSVQPEDQTDQPEDQPQPGTFDLSDFERELQALFESDPADTDDTDDPPDGDDGDEDDLPDEGGAAAEETAPPAVHETVQFNGRDFDRGEVDALVEFYDWARANPHHAVAIDSYLKGQAQFVPIETGTPAPAPAAPSQAEVDAFDDLDPAVRAKLDEIDQIKTDLAQVRQEREVRQHAEVQASISRGSETIKSKYGLTDEEVAELHVAAAALNVLPGLAQQRGDMTSAVEETLDIAYWSTPKFRDQAVAKYSQQQNEAQKRQAKASSLSGGSGSVPRAPKSPSTSEDRKLGMVSAIREAMSETTQE